MGRSVAAPDAVLRVTPLLVFGSLAALAAWSSVHFEPGQWYQELIKPDWTPADWLFALVWLVLDAVIALAGWRVWRRTGRVSLSLVLWCAQLALNTAWFWLFFGLHLPLLAFVDAVALLLVIAVSLAIFSADRAASLLFLAYALWLGFVATLNYAIWQLNLGLL